MRILVTGGLGYIGSHIVLRLVELGHDPIIVDKWTLENVIRHTTIKLLTGKDIYCYWVDLTKRKQVASIVFNIDRVIHLAAVKNIPESYVYSNQYYKNNLNALLNVISRTEVPIIFSSSCAVYGNNPHPNEDSPLNPLSPYAHSKAMCEQILKDSGNAYTMLRYFNPIGSHPMLPDTTEGTIISNILTGNVEINGNDYNTKDGTPVRDFIHIDDLVDAHIAALNKQGVYNIGTGQGTTIKELCDAFKVDYTFTDRRKGDIESIYADTNKDLGWKAKRTLKDIVENVTTVKSSTPVQVKFP